MQEEDMIEHAQLPAKGSDELGVDDLDVIFVDCDDTLYFNSWATAAKMKNAVAQFHTKRLNHDEDYALQLYEKHGTALRGLLDDGIIPPDRVEEYLHAIHNIPLDEISPNPELRSMFLRLGVRRWIFTASSREHALRCMKRIGVDDVFEGIIDCRDVDLVVKHDPAAFGFGMERAGVKDPQRCLLLDDSVQNLLAAQAAGMKSVFLFLLLVFLLSRCYCCCCCCCLN